MLTEQSKTPELGVSSESPEYAENHLRLAETLDVADLPGNVADTTAHAAPLFLQTELDQVKCTAEAELDQPRWAVISFDRCEAGNLTYDAAGRLLAELEAKGVTGLCIVTDQVAARLAV